MYKKNDVVTLDITDVTPEGMGVGKLDGYVVFVAGAAEGDVLRVKLLKANKSYGYAKTEEIISPSPARVAPDCPVFLRCGGCVYRHVDYAAELDLKKRWVAENFRRIGKFDVPQVEIFCAGSPNGYRNKAQYPAGADGDGKLRFGFYSKHSHRIAPCRECALQPPFYADIVGATENFLNENSIRAYDESTGEGIVRHLYIRHGAGSGEVMAALVINADVLPCANEFVRAVRDACPAVVCVAIIINKSRSNVILGDRCVVLWGKNCITDTLCGMEFDISPLSFYQVNRDGAEILYGIAKKCAAPEPTDVVLDLYCGTGTIGLSMAKDAGRVIGVEIVPSAVENARKNADKNGISNAEFICADAGAAAKKLAEDGTFPNILILDPPRKGCGQEVYEATEKMRPERIVMISCNSATAARDARVFADMGYALSYLCAVDMFPRTGHVETVASMERAER